MATGPAYWEIFKIRIIRAMRSMYCVSNSTELHVLWNVTALLYFGESINSDPRT